MSKKTLGIILAAGRSSRLFPATFATTKQLLPIYDKPLIYYPLTTLMLAGIRDFVVITNPQERTIFEGLLSSTPLGINIRYGVQPTPVGIADAFNVVHEVLRNKIENYDKFTLILGDNIYHGAGMTGLLKDAIENDSASVFSIKVRDPERFGVVEIQKGKAISIEEKPQKPKSDQAVTGLYVYPKDVFERVYGLPVSARGELEITDLNRRYLEDGNLSVVRLSRGMFWFDTGTPESMMEASEFIMTLQNTQKTLIGSPHEVAYHNSWITDSELQKTANLCSKNFYGQYLMSLIGDTL